MRARHGLVAAVAAGLALAACAPRRPPPPEGGAVAREERAAAASQPAAARPANARDRIVVKACGAGLALGACLREHVAGGQHLLALDTCLALDASGLETPADNLACMIVTPAAALVAGHEERGLALMKLGCEALFEERARVELAGEVARLYGAALSRQGKTLGLSGVVARSAEATRQLSEACGVGADAVQESMKRKLAGERGR